MLNSDIELTKSLSAAIAHLVPRAFGAGAELDSSPPTRIDRRYSFMFRYQVRMQNGKLLSLLVKIPHQDWVKSMEEAIASEQVRKEVKDEFEIMQSIYSIIQESKRPHLSAINPVGGYLLDFNAIVMEEVPLQMLKSYLSRSSIIMNKHSAWTDFENMLNRAGEWLMVIHTAFQRNRTATLGELDVWQKTQDEISVLESITKTRLDSISALLAQLYKLIGNVDVPVSSLHNDYQLGNIFVTPENGVGALDPNWKERGAIYEDLASLLIDPVTRKFQVLFQGLIFRRAQRKRYEEAILQGYFDNTNYPLGVIYFYCALAALGKWHANEELLRSHASQLARIMILVGSLLAGLYFRRLIQDYLKLGLDSAKILNERK